MRKLIALFALAGLFFSCNGPETNQSEATDTKEASIEQEENKAYYGAVIKGENIVSGEDMMKMLEENDSVYVTLKGTIVSNCQVSGCWMDLDLGSDELAKVTFKDYDFVIPLDSKGKTATVEGVAKREIIPVDLLRHYAEDEGKSAEEIAAITEDEIAYTFEAVGVIIED
ncbi:MAG: DUF4920 domain-containing protein [Bacteroidetes bacterium]|nr:DUF4920 domain-containing protein [Bacteroidota bacterium]